MCVPVAVTYSNKFLVRAMFVFIALLFLTACAAPSGPAVEPWGFSDTRIGEIYPYQKLRAKVDGWQIWETASKKRAACVALKSATGTALPHLSAGDGIVTGDGGFYMVTRDDTEIPYLGFYGEYPYARKVDAAISGKVVSDVNNRNTVLGWDGANVSFQVITQPYGGLYSSSSGFSGEIHLDAFLKKDEPSAAEVSGKNFDSTSGEVDFTGVKKAYEAMMQCRSRIAVS